MTIIIDTKTKIIEKDEKMLYAIAKSLIIVAETGNYNDVVKLNETKFNPLFNQVFPSNPCNDSLAMIYDVLRNKCVMVAQNAQYGDGKKIPVYLEAASECLQKIPENLTNSSISIGTSHTNIL